MNHSNTRTRTLEHSNNLLLLFDLSKNKQVVYDCYYEVNIRFSVFTVIYAFYTRNLLETSFLRFSPASLRGFKVLQTSLGL